MVRIKASCNAVQNIDIKMNVLQQHKTVGCNSASHEQKSEAIMGTDSPNLETWGLRKKVFVEFVMLVHYTAPIHASVYLCIFGQWD